MTPTPPPTAAAQAAEGAKPRSVTPGLENQWWKDKTFPEPGMFCGLDWLRLTADDDRREWAHQELTRRFGPMSRKTAGAAYFKGGTEWEPGVQLSYGHSHGRCMIDVRGERLRTLSGDDAIEFLGRWMKHGFRPTRVDIALDWIGQGVDLCEKAKASCEAKELCRLRTYDTSWKRQANGLILGKLLKLGNRESSVCARIYDKGLEQKLGFQGYWERLEAEFKEHRAEVVAAELIDAREAWATVAVNAVLGAVDFRERNGRSELGRRPRAAWWSSLTAGFSPCRYPANAEEATFREWAHWLRGAAGRRLLQIAEAAGVSVGSVVERLLIGLTPATDRPRLVGEAVGVLSECSSGTVRSLAGAAGGSGREEAERPGTS